MLAPQGTTLQGRAALRPRLCGEAHDTPHRAWQHTAPMEITLSGEQRSPRVDTEGDETGKGWTSARSSLPGGGGCPGQPRMWGGRGRRTMDHTRALGCSGQRGSPRGWVLESSLLYPSRLLDVNPSARRAGGGSPRPCCRNGRRHKKPRREAGGPPELRGGAGDSSENSRLTSRRCACDK